MSGFTGIIHMESGQLQPSELVSLLLYVVLLTRPLAGLALADRIVEMKLARSNHFS
jgi:hypothetical protein